MATEEADEHCLENIDEFVHDENKIVTCKWLSLTLKIHINQAKRLLYHFLQQQRNKKDKDVSATYFVAGLKKGSNGVQEHTCLVVPEEDLEVTRKQLDVVTSCHVYSVQRTQLKDSSALYITDFDGVKENLSECTKYSSIRCQKASVPRKVLRPSEKQKADGPTADKENKLNGATGDHSSTSSISKSKKAEPKGSIASMFAHSVKRADTDASKAKDEASNDSSKNGEKTGGKAAAKKGGVMDFFANAKPAAKNKVEDKPPPKKAEDSQTQITASANGEKGGKTRDVKSKKKSRPKDDSDDDDGPWKKRRRRIKNDDDFDSSSDEEMEILEESPIPSPAREPSAEPESPMPTKEPEKEEEVEKETENHANGTKGRQRRRKLVPKTSLDEDGYLVTEKVWESESTDASEVEEESQKKTAPAKQPAPAPAKKTSPQKKGSPAKGKQTSLMSFFKKK